MNNSSLPTWFTGLTMKSGDVIRILHFGSESPRYFLNGVEVFDPDGTSERMVWMDRIIYYADGRKEVQRQYVPEGSCKHDDGECHEEDRCANCPAHDQP